MGLRLPYGHHICWVKRSLYLFPNLYNWDFFSFEPHPIRVFQKSPTLAPGTFSSLWPFPGTDTSVETRGELVCAHLVNWVECHFLRPWTPGDLFGVIGRPQGVTDTTSVGSSQETTKTLTSRPFYRSGWRSKYRLRGYYFLSTCSLLVCLRILYSKCTVSSETPLYFLVSLSLWTHKRYELTYFSPVSTSPYWLVSPTIGPPLQWCRQPSLRGDTGTQKSFSYKERRLIRP